MWIIYPLIFAAGFVDSIAGGGGLISLTAYTAIGLSAHMALGTNKFSSCLGTATASARYVKSGSVQWPSAVLAIVGALAGSAFGARMALRLDERYLQYLMLALVPLIAVFTAVNKSFGVGRPLPRGRTLTYSLLAGLAAGAYDGFFGPGTGAFLTILFTAVIGLDMATACGNAKLVNLASNLAAIVTFVANGSVNYRLGIPCALCGILGNYLGAGMAIKNGAKLVRPVLLAVVGLLLVKIVMGLF